MYLVDYDLSVVPASRRVQFYRKFKKLKISYKIFTGSRSTYSVFYTQNRALAEAVYKLALKFGAVCHLYDAKRLLP